MGVRFRCCLTASAATQRARAIERLGTGGIIRLRDLAAEGISAETVARLVREGVAIRQARGLYQAADAPIDARHMLAEAATLAPKAVICLSSALQFHNLTLQRPSAVWMAIDRTGWKPTASYAPMRFVRFSRPLLTEGVERHQIEGVLVTVFDAQSPWSTASDIATRLVSTLRWKGCARAYSAGASRSIS